MAIKSTSCCVGLKNGGDESLQQAVVVRAARAWADQIGHDPTTLPPARLKGAT